MTDYYVYNGPLQYFLSRLIDEKCAGSRSVGIQYTDCGDFSSVFREIDNVLGLPKREEIRFQNGVSLPFASSDRIFLSNRFNPTEIELFRLARGRVGKVCAFEDGLALYIRHNFRNPTWHDRNLSMRAKNLVKEFALLVGWPFSGLPSFFPVSAFDEFYSMFGEIPGRRRSSKWVDMSSCLRELKNGSSNGRRVSGTLILSQSIVNDGLANEADYVAFLKGLVRDLSSDGRKIFFKPHPRDSDAVRLAMSSESSCVPLPTSYQNIPVEIFLAINPDVDVYGFWSSALAYSSGVLGQKAYTFAPIFLRGNHMTRPGLGELWRSVSPLLKRHGVNFME